MSTDAPPTAPPTARESLAGRLGPWLLFLVAPLVIFPWGFIAGGLVGGGEDLHVHLPDLHYAARRLLSLDLLWAPDLLLGQPMLREPRFAIFYPVKLLVLLGDPLTGFGLYVYVHFLLAQVGTYLYLRALGVSRMAAAFGGLAFGFGGYMLGQRAHTHHLAGAAWAPLVLYFLERVRRGGRRRDYLGAALAFAMVPIAGALQLSAYLLWLSLLLAASRAVVERSRRPLVVTLLALLPAVMMAALQWLPSTELVGAMVPDVGPRPIGSGAWHPTLLATLALPTAPVGTGGWELYARAGVAVLAAAVAALVLQRRRPDVRAWGVALVVSLVLMMGTNVPLLGDLVDALPLAAAFRHPVRHGFELSLALAVLAALGLQAVLDGKRLPGHWLHWAVGAALVVGGAGVLGRGIAYTPWWDPPVARFLGQITAREVALATALAAAWAGLLAGIRRPGRAFALVPLALLLVEGRVAMRRALPGPFPSYRGELAQADFRKDRKGFARVLAPPPEVGPRLLPGNTALLAPGVQRLAGDVTAPGRDMATVLGLTPAGEPRNLADLRWSRLPDLLGATHVIMPDAVCSTLGFSLDQEGITTGSCNSDTAPHAVALRPPAVGCRYDLVPESQRVFRVQALIRQLGAGVATAKVRLVGGGRTTRATFAPARLQTRFRPHLARIDLEGMPSRVEVGLEGEGDQGFIVQDVRLETARPQAVDTMDPARARDRVASDVAGKAVVLRPANGLVASVVAPVRWRKGVPRHGRFTLEVVARAIAPAVDSLQVGLLSGRAGFPAKAARLTIPAADLAPAVNAFERSFVLGAVPPDVAFSVRLPGESGEVEVRSVTLWSYVRDTGFGRLDTSFATPVRGSKVSVGPQGLEFPAGDASIAVPYYLPRRPVRIWVHAVKGARGPQPVALALRSAGTPFGPEAVVEARARAGVARVSQTFDVAPDARTIELRARSGRKGPPTPEGVEAMSRPVAVAGITGEDACRGRSYQPVRTLGNGLTLYRNLNAMPRLYTVSQLFPVENPAEARRVVRDHPAFLVGRSAAVETDEQVPSFAMGAILEARFRSARVEAVVRSPQGATFLVLNDRYDPRWRASVDDAPVRIYRTNGVVRGVVVPQGTHVVRFWYALPGTTLAGSMLATLGVLLALLVMPWFQRRLDA